jgi:transcription elongation factor Elf1
MTHSSYLRFNCPSCGTKLAGIEPVTSHTQVVKRTCSGCGDRWQLIVKIIAIREGMRIDKAEIVFIDNRNTRRAK